IFVSITNHGEGIPAQEIPRLTERFYRVDKGRSRSMGGTGLGLAIVKHIVARHRGHLEVKSEVNKETSFTVMLPRSDENIL
ncbi:MAG: ATP-binding protein, partial [Pseudomonadota bacterium]|nr:ATP-binding protein [Pseudomonadota bacterium]